MFHNHIEWSVGFLPMFGKGESACADIHVLNKIKFKFPTIMGTWGSKNSSTFEGSKSASGLSFTQRRKWQNASELESHSSPLSNSTTLPPNHCHDKGKNLEMWTCQTNLIYWSQNLQPSVKIFSVCQGIFKSVGHLIRLGLSFLSTKLSKARFPLCSKHLSCNIILVLLKRYTHIQGIRQAVLLCEHSYSLASLKCWKNFL